MAPGETCDEPHGLWQCVGYVVAFLFFYCLAVWGGLWL